VFTFKTIHPVRCALELAVVAAISLFGFNSGAAPATVVGVLIEVPARLSVVWIVNRIRDWYEPRRRADKPSARVEAV
jgi:arsenite transporter